MKELTVKVPEVGHIVIAGPVQIGKSVLLARIERMLIEEFGAATVSPCLDAERRGGRPDVPADWERRMVRETIWSLSESIGK